MDVCDICGDLKSSSYIQRLDCGHEFHYECILRCFKSSKSYSNLCPICRQPEVPCYKIKSGIIKMKCVGCGHRYVIDSCNKLCPFILKNESQKKKKSKTDDKSKKREKKKVKN